MAEDPLRESGTDLPYRLIVETANVGIWFIDPEGRTTYANATMAEILGYEADEMARLTVFDVLDEQGREQAAANLERRRQGHTAQLECAFLRNGGSHVWVLLNAGPLRDESGRYLGSVSIVSEITDRKHVEQALQQRDQELIEAQRVARLGSWEWDLVTDVVTWSDQLYRVLGLEPGAVEPSRERFLAQVHPGDRRLAEERLQAALDGGDAFEFETRIVRPDGGQVWVRSGGTVTRDGSGTPVRMRGTALDITAFKRAETALQETTARYRLLERLASAANEASGLGDVLQTAVDEICAHTGWPVGHAYVPSEHDHDLLISSGIWHLDDADRFETLRAVTAATTFRPGPTPVGAQLIDSSPVWISDVSRHPAHARARAVPDLGVRSHLMFPVRLEGSTVAVLEFFNVDSLEPDPDLLETLRQAGTQLGRVSERERARAALATARDSAMEASRLKSEFLAMMSHEIRTPMNGVIGLTGLLLATELDERQRQYADGVHSAGQALLAIINDILDFSKIEAGRLDIEVVEFDPVTVVEEVADLVADPARRKGLELVAFCFPDVPTQLSGDPSRLRQVLLNLTANAVKFTERGEVVIRARLAAQQHDAVSVRFEVTDTGIGIDDGDRSRLFQPFSQADSSTTRRFGGTGLGLAISARLVAAMGGELTVDSVPGRGSTFSFSLPFGRGSEEPGGPIEPYRHLLEGRRVLVVDDNETNRTVLREQLMAWDIRADAAGSGRSGLRRLTSAAGSGEPYDLVLADLGMEDLDGLELAGHIAADPALATTRVVLMTPVDFVAAPGPRPAGVSACLTKPLRSSQLFDSLMKLIAPPMRSRELRPPGLADPALGAHGHVLVVEDNATNQLVAVGILEHLGYSADVAANGFEALAALDRRDYEAVLMDCQMPEMDGYTATAEIRRREGSARRTPVIAMTAGAVEGDRDRCLAAGMDDYISKPVSPDSVDDALARWTTGRAGAGARGPDPAAVPAVVPGAIDGNRLDLLRRVGPADGSLLSSMVAAFLVEAPASVAEISHAVAAHDAESLGHSAHRLRGSAATLGATGVVELCSRLERLGDTADLSAAPGLIEALRVELDRATSALRTRDRAGPE